MYKRMTNRRGTKSKRWTSTKKSKEQSIDYFGFKTFLCSVERWSTAYQIMSIQIKLALVLGRKQGIIKWNLNFWSWHIPHLPHISNRRHSNFTNSWLIKLYPEWHNSLASGLSVCILESLFSPSCLKDWHLNCVAQRKDPKRTIK